MLLRIMISFVMLFLAFTSFGQIKGKALNLVGTWKYNEGSGYEIWNLSGGELIGSGYRSTKIGDSVKVEDLKISLVNDNLIYTLITKQVLVEGDSSNVFRFIGNKRKLFFVNINNEMPVSIRYKFCFFNKNKLQIQIKYDDKDSSKKLKLTRL